MDGYMDYSSNSKQHQKNHCWATVAIVNSTKRIIVAVLQQHKGLH
jgi:hypothetical protein